MPLLRSWRHGSAGSGKSAALNTVAPVRHLLHQGGTTTTVELVAYTGVVAFSIGFGARIDWSAFHVVQHPMGE